MITRFRQWLCRRFSHHEMIFDFNGPEFEVSHCKWCGLRSARAHWTNDCKLLIDGRAK